MPEPRRVEPAEQIAAVHERFDTRKDRVREAARRKIAALRRDEARKVAAIKAGAHATRLSDNGAKLIASFEGWVDHVYLDAAGLRTIGYGHLLKPGEVFPAHISIEAGLKLLMADARIAVAAVNTAVDVDLSQNEFDALTSLAFNIGSGAFSTSTLVRLLNAGDRAGAAAQFGVWINAGGRPVQGLINRRRAEAALFRKKG